MTLAFSEIARLVILNWNSVTNGSLGINADEQADALAAGPRRDPGRAARWRGIISAWSRCCLTVAGLHARRALVDGTLLRGDPPQRRARRHARDQRLPLQAASPFSSATAGAAVAGALYAFYLGYIEPNYLSIDQSLAIIAMALLGGREFDRGPDHRRLRPDGAAACHQSRRRGAHHGLRPHPDPHHPADAAGHRRPRRKAQTRRAGLLLHSSSRAMFFEAANLTKRFGGLTAVSDMSFAIAPRRDRRRFSARTARARRRCSISSPASDPPTAGRLLWKGARASSAASRTRSPRPGIVKTFQNPQLFAELTVLEQRRDRRHTCRLQRQLGLAPPSSTLLPRRRRHGAELTAEGRARAAAVPARGGAR